jgi:NADPH:quinone reductase
MNSTMRAAVLESPTSFQVRRIPIPSPGPKQVLIRVEGCGVCGSNLAPWEGRPWFKYPIEAGSPGHEGWGEVIRVGSDVKTVLPGSRASFLSQRAFGEIDVADEDAVVQLPSELDGQPFPGEAIGCAVNVFRRSHVDKSDSVAVVGAGFLGLLLTALAANAGARVTAISRRQESLDRARLMNAAETLLWTSDFNLERQFDVVIEAVGNQAALDLATRLVRERGRLIIAGYHQDGPRTVDMQLWNWRGIDVVNAHERNPAVYVEGMRLGVVAVASGAINLKPLLTHRFPLEHINQAFSLMQNRAAGFCKAIIEP